MSIVAQQPLADAALRLGGPPLTGEDGRLEQKRLDPGTYDVRAVSRDGKQQAEPKDVVVTPGAGASVTLQLR